MSDNLKMAVNALERDYTSSRIRFFKNMGYGLGSGGSAKHRKLWKEAGYPEFISPVDLYQKYTRGGYAHGIVKKLTDLVWETNPYIVEGDIDNNKHAKETAVEAEIKKWANKINLWSSFKSADIARTVCEYSALIIYIKDGKELGEPLESISSINDIEGFKFVWQHELTVSDREENRSSINYQKPKSYNYIEYKPDGVSNQNTKSSEIPTVHASRVFLIGDLYGIGADANGNRYFVPCYNNIVGLEQIDAAGTSGTVKAAAQHMTWNYEGSSAMTDLAKQYGVKVSELNDAFQEMVDRVNTSLDSAIITSGAQISTLDVDMPDLDQARKGHQEAVSAATGLAWTELVGHQVGERSSEENSKSTRKTAKSRQNDVETQDVNNFFRWLQSLGLWKGYDLQVAWDDLLESTTSEKLENAGKMADINQKSASNGNQVFTAEEIRVTAGYEAVPKKSQAEQKILDDGEKMDEIE